MWEYLQHFFAGFIITFIGIAPPGIISLTALKVAVEKGEKAGIQYAFGVMWPDIIQAHIAILGAEYILSHPKLLDGLSRAAIVILIIMAYLVYRQGKEGIKQSAVNKYNIRDPFLYGLFISAINPMAIPFYFTYSSILKYYGVIRFEQPYASIYIAGAVLGAFTLLSIYSVFARKIIGKIAFIARNFYFILSGIYTVLAIFVLVGILNK